MKNFVLEVPDVKQETLDYKIRILTNLEKEHMPPTKEEEECLRLREPESFITATK